MNLKKVFSIILGITSLSANILSCMANDTSNDYFSYDVIFVGNSGCGKTDIAKKVCNSAPVCKGNAWNDFEFKINDNLSSKIKLCDINETKFIPTFTYNAKCACVFTNDSHWDDVKSYINIIKQNNSSLKIITVLNNISDKQLDNNISNKICTVNLKQNNSIKNLQNSIINSINGVDDEFNTVSENDIPSITVDFTSKSFDTTDDYSDDSDEDSIIYYFPKKDKVEHQDAECQTDEYITLPYNSNIQNKSGEEPIKQDGKGSKGLCWKIPLGIVSVVGSIVGGSFAINKCIPL